MSVLTQTKPLSLLPAVSDSEIERQIKCVATIAGSALPTIVVDYTASSLDDTCYIATMLEQKTLEASPEIASVELEIDRPLEMWGMDSVIFCTKKNADSPECLRVKDKSGKNLDAKVSLLILSDSTNKEELTAQRIKENDERRTRYFHELMAEFDINEKQLSFIVGSLGDPALRAGGFATSPKDTHARLVRTIIEFKDVI